MVKIAGSNAFTTKGAQFSGTLTKSGNFNDNDTIALCWGVNILYVYIKALPVNDFDIGTDAGNPELLAAIMQHQQFITDFDCYLEDGIIKINARQAGSDYQLTFQGDAAVTLTQLQEGINAQLTDNYRIAVTAVIDGKILPKSSYPVSGDLTEELPENFDASKTGEAQVDDINDLLVEEQRGHFTFPFDSNVFYTKRQLAKSFRLFASEESGIPVTSGAGKFSDYLYAIQGKIGDFRQGQLNDLGKSFSDYLQQSGMFLSFCPAEKLTDIYAPEVLSFIFFTAGNYSLTVREFYEDGTYYTANRALVSVNAFETVEFDTSYAKIRTHSPLKVTKYQVWLTDSEGSTASEVRTFVLDYRYQQYARYFKFLSPRLGIYETIRTTGAIKKSRNVAKEFVTIPLKAGFNETGKSEKQISANTTVSYDFNAGYFPDKYYADWFQEFLESPDVYWLKNGQAYPVNIQDSKNTVSEDGDYNPEASFTLTHAVTDDFTENFQAQEPVKLGDLNLDFNTDFFLGDSDPVDLTLSLVTKDDVSVYDGSDGAIRVQASGGAWPYTYAWNDGAEGETRENLTAGSYTVIVTDANNDTAQLTVEITQPLDHLFLEEFDNWQDGAPAGWSLVGDTAVVNENDDLRWNYDGPAFVYQSLFFNDVFAGVNKAVRITIKVDELTDGDTLWVTRSIDNGSYINDYRVTSPGLHQITIPYYSYMAAYTDLLLRFDTSREIAHTALIDYITIDYV